MLSGVSPPEIHDGAPQAWLPYYHKRRTPYGEGKQQEKKTFGFNEWEAEEAELALLSASGFR